MNILKSNSKALVINLCATVLFLVLGAVMWPQTALAAGETYTWSGNDISGQNGLYSPDGVTFRDNGSGIYVGNAEFGDQFGTCEAEWRISNISSDRSTGTLTTVEGCENAALGTVTQGRISFGTSDRSRSGGGEFGSTAATEEEDICASPTGELGWVICPMTNFVMEGAVFVDELIVTLLKVDTASMFDSREESSSAFRVAWGGFRNLAYAALLIFALVMLVAYLAGLEIFSAYDIRKTAPKLFVAAVAIPLLLPILGFIFNMANESADAVMYMIREPFQNVGRAGDFRDILSAQAVVGALLVAGVGIVAFLAASGAVWPIILPIFASLLIAVMSGFFIIAARDIVAYTLVIASPIAVVCAAFDATKVVFKFWRNLLATILLSIPAIAALLAASKVAAAIAFISYKTWGVIMAFIFVIAGYGLFWKVFKQLDKVSGQIDNATNSVTAGLKKRLGKSRDKALAEGGQQVGDKITRARAQLYRRLNAASSKEKPGGGRRRGAGLLRGMASAIGGRNIELKESEAQKRLNEELELQISNGSDIGRRALTVDKRLLDNFDQAVIDGHAQLDPKGSGKRQFKTLGGAWVDEADVRTAHKRWSGDKFAQQAAFSYEVRKAGSVEEVKYLTDNYARVAGGWGLTDAEAAGTWKGAAFQNQNAHLQLKTSDWRTGRLQDADTFISEIYERRGSYPMSQMGGDTTDAIKEAWNSAAPAAGDTAEVAQAKLARRQKIVAVVETWMYEGGLQQGGEEGGVPIPGAPPAAAAAAAAAAAGAPPAAAAGGAAGAPPAAPAPIPPRLVSVPGAARFAEGVVELAEITGAAWGRPRGQYASATPAPPAPPAQPGEPGYAGRAQKRADNPLPPGTPTPFV